MILSPEDARLAIYNKHKDFKVMKEEIIGKSRWETHHETILKHLPTKRFYLVEWSKGATEMQDTQAFEYVKEVELVEVIETTKVISVYEKV
mgnify:CR=1 FL=1